MIKFAATGPPTSSKHLVKAGTGGFGDRDADTRTCRCVWPQWFKAVLAGDGPFIASRRQPKPSASLDATSTPLGWDLSVPRGRYACKCWLLKFNHNSYSYSRSHIFKHVYTFHIMYSCIQMYTRYTCNIHIYVYNITVCIYE